MVISSIRAFLAKGHCYFLTRLKTQQCLFCAQLVRYTNVMYSMSTMALALYDVPSFVIFKRYDASGISWLTATFRKDNGIVQQDMEQRFVRNIWCDYCLLSLLCWILKRWLYDGSTHNTCLQTTKKRVAWFMLGVNISVKVKLDTRWQASNPTGTETSVSVGILRVEEMIRW